MTQTATQVIKNLWLLEANMGARSPVLTLHFALGDNYSHV